MQLIDPQALTATGHNSERNGVNARVELLGLVEDLPEKCDVLMANILLNPLVSLAPEFARRVSSHGRLVMSGVLEEQVDELWCAYADTFELETRESDAGWACVVARRLG